MENWNDLGCVERKITSLTDGLGVEVMGEDQVSIGL